VPVLQKVPLSSQAASHLSVGDGDGVHPWYMMLRRFSSRSAKKWAEDLAARVKKSAGGAEYRVRVERDWWGACGPWGRTVFCVLQSSSCAIWQIVATHVGFVLFGKISQIRVTFLLLYFSQ